MAARARRRLKIKTNTQEGRRAAHIRKAEDKYHAAKPGGLGIADQVYHPQAQESTDSTPHKDIRKQHLNTNITHWEQRDPRTVPTLLYGTRLRIATFNCRGINQTAKRQEIKAWMRLSHIDILLVQETRQKEQTTANGADHLTYFSSSEKEHTKQATNVYSVLFA